MSSHPHELLGETEAHTDFLLASCGAWSWVRVSASSPPLAICPEQTGPPTAGSLLSTYYVQLV